MNWPDDFINRVVCGGALDILQKMPDGVVQTCITSPPYWGLRDYGVTGQIGLESTPEEYVAKMVEVFREVRRVLRDDGTLWLNLGDSYANDAKWGGKTGGKQSHLPDNDLRGCGRGKRKTGLKPKDLCMIPARVAMALQADGWYLRSEIIWHKPNGMPESVEDRPTTAHEKLFLLSKNAVYHYDGEAIKVPAADSSILRWQQNIDAQAGSDRQPGKSNGPMRAVGGPTVHRHRPGRSDGPGPHNDPSQELVNRRTVWTISPANFKHAHFAVMPDKLIDPCLLAGSPPGGIVLDNFSGSGTVGKRSKELGRKYICIDLSEEYCKMARQRVCQQEIFGANLI